MKKKFDIEGMTCANCQLTIEKSIKKLGVDNVKVSLLTNVLEVEGNIEDKVILDTIKSIGYKAIPRNKKVNNIKNPKNYYLDEIGKIKMKLIISIPFMLILMYISMGDMINLPYPKIFKDINNLGIFSLIQFLLSMPILYVNRDYFIKGFKALFIRHPNMDSLVALGSSAAVIYGVFTLFIINFALGHNNIHLLNHYRHELYFESATMILTLITLGKFFELNSKIKTTEAINKLIEFKPETVVRVKDNIEEIIKIEDIRESDIIKVLPGDRVAIDGVIVEGSSSIDTSFITGEPIPIEVNKGDKVISGAINNNGYFLLKATKVGEDTTISKIINLMEEASSTKAPISKLADKISSIFVPIVIILSIITFIFWITLGNQTFTFAFSTAIGVLVISCPCALGLATPVAMMVANGKSAENGILVKDSEALENLHKIDAIVFDKTGTITNGNPVLTDIITINDFSIEKSIEIACSIEIKSQHPLSLPFIKYAKDNKVNVLNVDKFNSIIGKGLEAYIDNELYYLGNINLLKEKININYNLTNILGEYSKQGKTVVFLFNIKEILSIFVIADSIKETSKKAIKDLKEFGIKTYMLTGDNSITSEYIAKEVGIDEYKAELLPNQKDEFILQLKNENNIVAMVGDGINDTPSLIRSDIGIAIADGTDIAIDSADLVLIKSDLQDIVNAYRLSHVAIKTIKENLFWAFIYNIISIPLAMGIFYNSFGIKLSPMISSIAMSLSSIFVVMNSLRIKRFKNNNLKYNENNYKKTNINILNLDLSDKINIEDFDKNLNKEDILKNKVLKIEGMSCTHCKLAVEKALKDFVEDVEVSLEDKTAMIKYKNNIDDEKLREVIEEAGYKLTSIQDESK